MKPTLPSNEEPLIPASFQSMESYKQYTSKLLLEKFESFISKASHYQRNELLEPKDKNYLMEVARAVIDTRGRGIKSWLTLQAFRQCLNEEETPKHLDLITTIAIAYHARFAAYEILDDLPPVDNDKERRGKPSVWDKYGEETAILFAKMLSTFSNYLIHEADMDRATKERILKEFNLTDMEVLTGATIHLNKKQLKHSPDALDITLKSHYLKSASFTSYIMGSAALAAGADEKAIAKIKDLGISLAHCGQIINDIHSDDVMHDIRTNSPNIVSSAGKGNIKEGIATTKQIYKIYRNQAQNTLNDFDVPNRHFTAYLKNLDERFEEKISDTIKLSAGHLR